MTKTFRDLGVDPALCDALAENGITHPFPIQELTLPLALEGHDLIGQARTGTGKTLAFGLPLLQRLDASTKQTQALVIVPTRELCLQVYSDLQIGAARGLTSISVYGGVGYDEQIDALHAGAQVVVGTPGRLLDLLNRGVLDLTKVTQLVLDEADEMLDMGFLPDVEQLVEACKGSDRHTMLFSATMPTAIVKLARRYMDHPTFTRADHEQKNTAPLVTQYFFEVHRMDKPRLLARILQTRNRGGVYVFVRTKHMADRLVNDLEELRIPSIAIHGDLRQTTREKNLDRFRSGQATVLVCTEVAARGLDVTGVTHVVNYDCPDDEKMYLHRIGRTARAGEAGVAITFAEFNEIDRLNVIRKAVGATDSEVQQIFSTSKQLRELFELPDERPWDHLSTKAGSDEARSKRESRSDGKPKSGRSREGRGGDHDARRPEGREDGAAQKRDSRSAGRSGRRPSRDGAGEPTRERKPARDGAGEPTRERKPARDGAGEPTRERKPARDGAGEPTRERKPARDGGGRGRARTVAAGPTTGPTDSAVAENASEQATERSTSSGERSGSSAPATRTRTRTRARSTSASTSEDSGAKNQNITEDTGERGSSERSSTERSSSGRQRARGGASAGGARTRRGNEPSETSPDRDEPTSERRNGQGSTKTKTTKGTKGTEDSTNARGRARGGGGRGERAETSSRGGGGSGRSAKANDRSDRSDRSARDSERSDRSARDSERSDRSARDSERSGRGGGLPEADPTVQVARRGEDARGGGQPQVARRVKVEHLP